LLFELVLTAVATAIGIGLVGGLVRWTRVSDELQELVDRSHRVLQREIATAAANEALARGTITRLRRQRDELLKLTSDARSALIEVQAEARAREEQIRRQAMDSGFGSFR